MNNLVKCVIESVSKSKTSFCKFISANDAGSTGAHQEGFYIPKNSIALMFDSPRLKGKNDERLVTIKWQNDFETQSRFIYYGQGTRNEYRLTRFGRGFPFLTDDHVGDLFILSHIDSDYYEGFILATDEDIEEFFAAYNLSSDATNQLINKNNFVSAPQKILDCFKAYVDTLRIEFPVTFDLALNARRCYNGSHNITDQKIKSKPDEILLNWLIAEFDLFKSIENDRYAERIKNPFVSVEELINFANTILNRRKSRAGKSLEHHLSEIFSKVELKYEAQVVTEENKRPDFIFPDAVSYHDTSFDSSSLVFLAAKTTCKDRWRQVLNEADRIPEKHLFTIQQGISANQLAEMYKYNVKLIVPQRYLSCFPEIFQDRILTLDKFVDFVKAKQI